MAIAGLTGPTLLDLSSSGFDRLSALFFAEFCSHSRDCPRFFAEFRSRFVVRQSITSAFSQPAMTLHTWMSARHG
jgi:hypothetical protein